jgi:hypothetical protein
LLLWFESNGSHRHMRVTLSIFIFCLGESRLPSVIGQRFQQNVARRFHLAAAWAEKRGHLHEEKAPPGKPSNS